MELSDDDVLEILKLFEQSYSIFFESQHGERKITVSKGGFAVNAGAPVAAAVPPAVACFAHTVRPIACAAAAGRRGRRPCAGDCADGRKILRRAVASRSALCPGRHAKLRSAAPSV